MATPERRIRALLGKLRIDAHDKGLRYVAEKLRQMGVEVILIRYGVIDEVVKVAKEEDVDVIGLSFYGAGLMHDTTKLAQLLKKENMEDKIVLVGGTIPSSYVARLEGLGVKGVFGPGDPIDEVLRCVEDNLACYGDRPSFAG